MIRINKPIDIIDKMLGEQKHTDKKYRCFKYTHITDVDGGILIYNLVTRELLFLDATETNEFYKIDMCSKTVADLIKNWFLVPEDADDYLISCQVEGVAQMLANNDKFPPFTSYTILTTTDCNARCFYCYELGCDRVNMSEQTAHDVAKYIKKKHGGQKVRICWFGGEPLYNSKAIDIICNDLIKMGVEYSSYCISNAYLFDQDMVKKAKELWKINFVQVSLDGTEEIYNRSKAYIYKDGASPFLIVLNNIENLLKAGIWVSIRLNIDSHNVDDLKELVNLLIERFSKYTNLKVYSTLLYEETEQKKFERDLKSKIYIYEKIDEINELLAQKDMVKKTYVERMRHVYPCMANNNNAIMILPDGKLGKCEAFINKNTFGSIYSDDIDEDAYLMFKKTGDLKPECKDCNFMPNCRHIIACPTTTKHCDEADMIIRIKDLNQKMLNSYLRFLETSKSFDDEEQKVEENCD